VIRNIGRGIGLIFCAASFVAGIALTAKGLTPIGILIGMIDAGLKDDSARATQAEAIVASGAPPIPLLGGCEDSSSVEFAKNIPSEIWSFDGTWAESESGIVIYYALGIDRLQIGTTYSNTSDDGLSKQCKRLIHSQLEPIMLAFAQQQRMTMVQK